MHQDIVIVRDNTGYRVLFGHLRLAGELTVSDEISLNLKHEGKVKVVKTPKGLAVQKGTQQVPLFTG